MSNTNPYTVLAELDKPEKTRLTGKSSLTSGAVLDTLQKMYSGSGWAFIRELKLGTGRVKRSKAKGQPRSIRQRIDAWAYNTWPSSGEIVAFEVKVSRQDFLNELKQPTKRLAAQSISHQFYLVTTPGVVRDESEIPKDCGWITVEQYLRGDEWNTASVGMVRKEAPTLGITQEFLSPLPRTLVNSLIRRLARAEGTYVGHVPRKRKRRERSSDVSGPIRKSRKRKSRK